MNYIKYKCWVSIAAILPIFAVENLKAAETHPDMNARHERVLKQSEADRVKDPDLYAQRLDAIDRYMQFAPRFRGGVRSGISAAMGPLLAEKIKDYSTAIHTPDAVPFLLEILINGPPSILRNKPDSPRFDRKSKEYELWIRCLAAGLVGRYKHPDVLSVLTNKLKIASEPELRAYAAIGIGRSMVPEAVDILLSALEGTDKKVWNITWDYVNYMTGRGWTSGRIPNEQQIAEFREWWQVNREDVVRKFYNPKTGRLEPKFENKRSQESAPSDQPVPVPQNTRSMDDYTSLCVVITGWPETMHNDPTVSWLVQYNDPNGKTTESQRAFRITSNSQSIILEWVDTGGELLATLIQNEVKRPWIYVENVKTSRFEYLNLPRDGDFILPLDRFVSIQIRSADWSRLQTFRELRLYHKENARLPLYTIPLASGQVDTDRGAWSAGIELVPMVYYIHATGGPDDGSVSLGTLDVQDNHGKTYMLSFEDRTGLKEP